MLAEGYNTMNGVLYEMSYSHSFDRAISNIYFEKILLINFICNLLKQFFGDLLLIEDFKQFAQQK